MTQNALTDTEMISYLLFITESEGGTDMKGTIRAKGSCTGCNGTFKEIKKIGLICHRCKITPRKFYIDLFHNGQRIRIFSDKQGQPLDTYQRAVNLQININSELKDFTFDPSKYLKAELEKYWTSNLLERFLKYKLASLAPSYEKDYERIVNIAKEYFKTKDVREFRKLDIINYKEFLESNFRFSNKTVKNILDIFKTFLRYLVNDLEIIDKVPPFPPIEVQPFKFQWLHAEDQIKLFELITDDHKPIIAFLMLHGSRPAEARALKCKDIDLKGKSITICSTFSNGIYREKRKGRRALPVTIPIHPEMYDFICERVKNNLPEAFIFVNPKTGSYYRETYLKRIWQTVRTKAGISNSLRLYDATRHSFASQLVNKNVSLYTVSKLLGHSTINTTERYSHSNIEHLRVNMNKLSLKAPTTDTRPSPALKSRRK